MDSNGDVQIGTDTSSGAKLTLFGSDAATTFQSSTTGTGAGNGFTTGNNGAVNAFLWNYEDGYMQFATDNTERMRIDSSGNVLVGTTSTSLATTSSETGSMITDGSFQAAANNPVAQFNRITTDGAIVNLRKDGSTVGSIASVGGLIQFGQGNANLKFSNASDIITPPNGS